MNAVEAMFARIPSVLIAMSGASKISISPNKQALPKAVATNALFQAAFSAHQAGRLADAQKGYSQVLLRDERHADASHLLGVVYLQAGNLPEAEKQIRKALAIREDALALGNLGNLLQGGRYLTEAEVSYRRALELKPDFADAHYNLGVLLRGLGRSAEAEDSFRRAVEFKPDFVNAHYNLGSLLKSSGRLLEAEMAYRHALKFKPDFPDAHNDLGILFKSCERLPEAETAFRRALALSPEFADAQYNLGLLLQSEGRLIEAEAAYLRAMALKPDFTDAHYNLGLLLQGDGRLTEAEAAYRRVLALDPDHVQAHNNLGALLKDCKRLSEAEAALRRALELDPHHAGAHNNLGVLLYDSHRLPEAEAALRCAMELKSGSAEARFQLSLLLLALGRYPEAWPLYESRYMPDMKNAIAKMPGLLYPQWQGESLAGRALVIWPEQGFGDYIQFARYAPLLKARGVSRLTLVCPQPLQALFETLDGVDAVVNDPAGIPAHDYWSFALSLPLHFATTVDTIPVAPLPYVRALPDRILRWRERLPEALAPSIGLVWKGSLLNKNDGNRSLPGLRSLAPLWSVPGLRFISLQKGQGEDEAAQPPVGQALVALGAQMADFADSAAIVSQLDLVICVDTAIAHLAGAVNKPCWVLLPATGTDWRWQLDRLDSPWYPSVRLFRQSMTEDWSATIGELAAALDAWAKGYS